MLVPPERLPFWEQVIKLVLCGNAIPQYEGVGLRARRTEVSGIAYCVSRQRLRR